MPRTIRSINLDLIRWMNFGHENTAKKLVSVITNAAYLSKMATGDMEISDRKARSIEKELSLPNGWMDRDNIAVLKTPAEDMAVLASLAHLTPQAKTNLAKFLASCGEA
jgi:hypothetical protein